jgi:OmpA-OmpF porin, OOP family
MANSSYSWSDVRGVRSYSLPGPEHLGWWAAAAMLLSVLLHVVLFLTLDNLKIALGFERKQELVTGQMNVRQVEIAPIVDSEELPVEDAMVASDEVSALLEEIDIFEHLPPDQEIDIRPDALEPEFAIQLANPAAEGDPESMALEITSSLEVDAELPELGRMNELFPAAAIGQVTVDPGAMQADDLNLDQFAEDLLKKGAGGKVENGALDGLASMDEMMGLPADVLVGKKTLLPSDLLFEFNSADLRESAKVGLMKLGLLIDLNPGLHCWIEGHTDLVGSSQYNLDLSQRRAAAVKAYLVNSMRMDPSRIHSRGLGKGEPLVVGGDPDAQAPNRRVEIRMRNTPPPAQSEAAQVEQAPAPRAVLVRPNRIPTAEEMAPRAVAVEEPEADAAEMIPVAEPVDEEDIPLALPVEED